MQDISLHTARAEPLSPASPAHLFRQEAKKMPSNVSLQFNTSGTVSIENGVRQSSDSMNLLKSFSDVDADLIVEIPGTGVGETVDLSAVTNQAGNLEAFASVKALVIHNRGEINALTVSGSYFGTTVAISIPAGGALLLFQPDGVDITDSSNDQITVASTDTDYEVRIIGTKVTAE